jgi:hypothetical protein
MKNDEQEKKWKNIKNMEKNNETWWKKGQKTMKNYEKKRTMKNDEK